MTLRLIHTADWQIGKPFASFPPGLAGELAAARLSAIDRISQIARAQGALAVLVAGDVFDGERLDRLLIGRTLDYLRQHQDLTWVLLPGNHDPMRRGGVWERVQTIGLPANVVVLGEAKPFALTERAVILPAPVTSKAPGADPTAWMDAAGTGEGILRIGLAHGSIQGFDSQGESNIAIAPDRARRAGLSYLALGDWHGAVRIDARTWYSGTPEPDRYPANAPGFVLHAVLDGSSEPDVKTINSAQFQWRREQVMLSSLEDVVDLERTITQMEDARTILLRLRVTGALTLSEHSMLAACWERLAVRLRHLDVDMQDLGLVSDHNDLDVFGPDGALRQAASALLARAAGGSGGDSETARRALLKLHAYVQAAS